MSVALFLCIHKSTYVGLILCTVSQIAGVARYVCGATQPRKCRFSMFVLGRRETYMRFYRKQTTHTPWSANTYGNDFTAHSCTAMFPGLSRPPALLEVSIKKNHRVDVANEQYIRSK